MKKTKWTPETLCAAMEKYVFKTKFTKKDQSKLLEMSKNMGEFDPLKVISKFIGNFDIFGPAEKLLSDLEILCDFPNNAEFLGMKEEMNYLAEPQILTDRNGKTFISKTDVFLKVYQFITEKHFTDEVSKLILQSYGNKIYRKLKNSYELIPAEISDNMIDFIDSLLKNQSDLTDSTSFKLASHTVNEIGMNLSKFYDNQHDHKLLERLRDHLISLKKKKPIRSNKHFYENMYSKQVRVVDTIKKVLNEFCHIFQVFNIKKKLPHYPVLRILKDPRVVIIDSNFILLTSAMLKQPVPFAKTTKLSEDDILLTDSFANFQNNLEKSGLSIENFNIIEMDVNRTSREIAAPIIASNGCHYKFASDCFDEILEIFTTEFRWYDAVSSEVFYKLYRWIGNYFHIFDEKINVPYLIKVEIIEKIKIEAYKEFCQFLCKPKYDVPKNAKFRNVDEVEEELNKFVDDHKLHHYHWRSTTTNFVEKHKGGPFNKSHVLYFYHKYWVMVTLVDLTRLKNFLIVQYRNYEFQLCDQILSSADINNNDKVSDSFDFYIMHDIRTEKFDNIDELPYYLVMKESEDETSLYFYVYYNDTCMKKILDYVIGCYPEYKDVLESAFTSEYQKMEQNSDSWSLFLMIKAEVLRNCDVYCGKFKKAMKNYSTASPCETVPKIHKNAQQNLKSKDDPIMDLACKFFRDCFKDLGSLRNYSKFSGNKKILMRIFCEMRIEDQNDWHLFSEEVLEAIEVVLEQENRLESMRDKIDTWKSKWMNGDTLSTVSVQLFKTVLDAVGLKPSLFVLMPDIDYVKNMAELPLKMGYHALSILSPQRKRVYHQCQAQYLIFQYGVSDILWNQPGNTELKGVCRAIALVEMSKYENGYTSAEKVENSVEIVKYSIVAQKTPYSALCASSYDTVFPQKKINKFLECLGMPKFYENDEYAYNLKFFLMELLFKTVFGPRPTDQFVMNIPKAFTVSFPIVTLKKRSDFELWRKKGVLEYFNGSSILPCVYRTQTIGNYGECNDGKQFVDTHYAFDENDKLGDFIFYKESSKNADHNRSGIANQILKVLPKVILKTSTNYEPIEKLWATFEAILLEDFEKILGFRLSKLLPLIDEFAPFKRELSKYLEFTSSDGSKMYRKKKVGIVEPIKKIKQEKEEDKPKIVTKYVTETRIVESCEKCREIDKETMKFNRKFEEYEKEIEKNRRIIGQNEEDLITLKNQVTQNKHKYREEIQKQKEVIENRDGKIEQLHDELKQYREDLKIEREKLYEEVRESSKMSEENVKKMKTEMENMKLSEKCKSQCIEKLKAEYEQLKSSLEIEQENHLTTKWELEMSQAKERSLEEQLPQTFDVCPSMPQMVNLKTRNIQIVDEVLPENSELKKSEPSYVCLICITDIETGQNSTKCVKCCRKYHAECATSWLRMNSVCPVCKTFLRDPTDYPKL